MAAYRVTIPVTFVIEIDASNQDTAPVPLLNGDTPLIATRRAMWLLFHNENRDLLKNLGVKRLIVNGRWENFESVEIKDVKHPFAPLELAEVNTGFVPVE